MDRLKPIVAIVLLGVMVLAGCSSGESNQTPEQATQSNTEQQLSAGDIDTGE